MDPVNHSAVTPRKGRLARTFAKVLHIRAVTGVSHEKTRKDQSKKTKFVDDDDEEQLNSAVEEAFLAKLFATISSVKSAYAQLQFAQFPYDADGIQSADHIVVTELKNLSELKQCYFKKQLSHDVSPETTLLLSEIQEQRSLLKIYEITTRKLDSQLKLKDSEIIFLREKLAEANSENESLEKRISIDSSGSRLVPEKNTLLSELKPTHFIAYYHQTMKSIRSFVRLLISEMQFAEWDLYAAASSIEPGIPFLKPDRVCFAFESFVCRAMFDGFDRPNFSTRPESSSDHQNRRSLFFSRFAELKLVRPGDYLAWKPKSSFAAFCRAKYLRLVHQKMEASLFGNLDQRHLVESGAVFPETPFFVAFVEMAKRVWALHCLAFSFDPEVSIFRVEKGSRFSEVYMESLNDDEAFFSSGPEAEYHVAFTVVPGFRIGQTVVQCQVYVS